MGFAYRSGFNPSFLANQYNNTQIPTGVLPSVDAPIFDVSASESIPSSQPMSPDMMLSGMQTMLRSVFAQFQQTALQFQAFLSTWQPNTNNDTINVSSATSTSDIQASQLLTIDPESVEGQQQRAMLVSKQTPEDLKLTNLNTSQQQIFKTRQSLLKQYTCMEPDSPEGKLLAKRINQLSQQLGIKDQHF